MTLTRFVDRPLAPASFNLLFDRFFNEALGQREGDLNSFVPKVDVSEDAEAYHIHVAAPGLSKDAFKVEMEDRRLTISGERKFERQENGKRYHMVETQYGVFSRSFTLPADVKNDGIKAVYENGLLNVYVPKDQAKALTRSIEVK